MDYTILDSRVGREGKGVPTMKKPLERAAVSLRFDAARVATYRKTCSKVGYTGNALFRQSDIVP